MTNIIVPCFPNTAIASTTKCADERMCRHVDVCVYIYIYMYIYVYKYMVDLVLYVYRSDV